MNGTKNNLNKILLILMMLIFGMALSSACGKTKQSDESGNQNAVNETSEQTDQSNVKDTSEQVDVKGDSEKNEQEKTYESSDGSYERQSEIIEKLVIGHAEYGDDAFEEEGRLLDELSSIDELSGVKWKKIMDYWRSTEEGVELNKGVLPDGLPDDNRLCIVALGFQLNADGSMKDELFDRLNVVLASAEKYPNAYIVCTGGGTAANNKDVTEAGEMAKWLKEKGVSPERIIVEDKSITTAQNAMFTYDILTRDYPQVSDIAIISSDYHIATGQLFFEAEFLLEAEDPEKPKLSITSNAACDAVYAELSSMFKAGGLIELNGNEEKAFEIYYGNYDIHDLPEPS